MFSRMIKRRLNGKIAFIALLMLTSSALVRAQQDTTILSGTVTDPQAKVVSGARVTLINLATGAVRETQTGEDGAYVLTHVSPGAYNVRVEANGFKTSLRDNIQLLVRTAATLNLQLEIGMVGETITVTGGESKVNTSDATIGNAFTANQIVQLPLEGRNVVGLLSLQPGVVFLGEFSTDSRNGSVNGGKSDQSNVTLDGVDVNDQQNGFAFNSVLRVTTDSVQEFRVTTINSNADQGRSSGAQVALVTRSGTNKFHGAAFESHRNTVTSANDFFLNRAGQNRPRLIRNVFGASLGGPVRKDRFFFFLNYEGRRDASEVAASRTVPSADLRNGLVKYRNTAGQTVSLSPAQVTALDPAKIGPNQAALNLFKQYPLPNDFNSGDGINFFGFRFRSPISVNFNTYTARLDYNLSDRHNIFARGVLQNDKVVNAQQFPGGAPVTTGLENSKGLAVGDNLSLRTNLTNVFRYGYTRQGQETAGASTLSAISFRGLDDLLPLSRSSRRITPVHNLVDDVSWVKGNHLLSFGTNIRFIRNNRANQANSFPSAQTNFAWLIGSGSELRPADLSLANATAYSNAMVAALGIVTQGTARYNYNRDLKALSVGEPVNRVFAANEYEFYAQDAWRLKSNLMVNFGLRYGLYSPPWEVHGNQVAPNIQLGDWFNLRGANAAQGIPSNAAPAISFDLAGPANGKRGFYGWDKNNFAPRVSFAYSPGFSEGWVARLTGGPGKTSIRGGFNIAYDRIGSALAVTFDTFGSFGLSTVLSNPSSSLSSLTAPRLTSLNTIPSSLLLPAPPIGFPVKYPSGAFAISSGGLDDAIRTPYSMSFNFSIQRELPKNFTFEAAYVGRESRKLLIQSDLSIPVNLRDPASNTTYFQAAQQLIAANGTPILQVGKIPFWENIFPGLTATAQTIDDRYYRPSGLAGRFFQLNPGVTPAAVLTPTQIAYFLYNQFRGPSYVNALQNLDVACTISCSKFGRYAFFNDQFSALAGWRSVAPASYHSLQLMLRKRLSQGVQFDFNYTLAKSIDWSSTVERSTAFGGAVLSNPWVPGQRQAVSDYDVRRQFNANWIAELPFGKGKLVGSRVNSVADAFIGGWQVTGIARWTSGFPFSIINGLFFPTNWQINGFATPVGPLPETGTTRTITPNVFPDPSQAIKAFKNTVTGESGSRNVLRGDGFFSLDMGLGKYWKLPWEGHRLQFRWETFNLTNTVRFDVNSLSRTLDTAATFGNYTAALNNPRVMQFVLRYEF
ncbi:MAG: carboxypeptidase regulatory-like domain-containing protein [Blastocatellia bacterium]